MGKPFMRIPFTDKLPITAPVPASASTFPGAVAALRTFLLAAPAASPTASGGGSSTLLLTGAGLSVASGLADYRGENGTYTLNRTYRPIYYGEFVANHEARKRYWARSFLGWSNLHRARPNAAHESVKRLGELGVLKGVITQNVDSFHPRAHPDLPTQELHGYLRSTVCVHCKNEFSRDEFQKNLADLNPAWADFLEEMLAVGALDTEDPAERRKKGLRTNPDGDVDLPNAPYTTFRYPPCPKCLADPPLLASGERGKVTVDSDGAWSKDSTAGVLKPAVVMFGESIKDSVKKTVEEAVDTSDRILVVGSSLATYSAWRLVKRAQDAGKVIGVVNMGGVRGEDTFFKDIDGTNEGERALRCAEKAEIILPEVVKEIEHIKKTA